MNRLESEYLSIKQIAYQIRRPNAIERRNRFLILIAAHCGLKISEIVNLQLWQITCFLFADARLDPSERRWEFGSGNWLPMGIYKDQRLSEVYWLGYLDKRLLYGYVDLLKPFMNPEIPLFPVIRKNGQICPTKSISKKDAHKILFHMRTDDHLNWNHIRKIGIGKMIDRGVSEKEILDLTSYKSIASIRGIAEQFGLRIVAENREKRPIRGIAIRNSPLYWMEPFYQSIIENKNES